MGGGGSQKIITCDRFLSFRHLRMKYSSVDGNRHARTHAHWQAKEKGWIVYLPALVGPRGRVLMDLLLLLLRLEPGSSRFV